MAAVDLAPFDPMGDELTIAGRRLPLLRPASAERLIDERDYAEDERLPYWAEVWPSGRALAEALAWSPIAGRRVVELGCGVGVASLGALAAGARVLATDWYPPALDFARHNARVALGAELETMLVEWRDPPPALLARAPFDLIVAADVCYEARNCEWLLDLIPRLGRDLLMADPRRPDAGVLAELLVDEGWSHDVREVSYRGRPNEAGAIVRLHRLRAPASRTGAAGEAPTAVQGVR